MPARGVHLVDGLADGDDRPSFCGSLTQVLADVERCAEIGIDEVFVDVQFTPGGDDLDQYLGHLEQFATLI